MPRGSFTFYNPPNKPSLYNLMRTYLFLLLLCCSLHVAAQQGSEVIITKDGESVTTADINQFLLTIPEGDREKFTQDKKRIIEIIDNLLTAKIVLRDASEHGVIQRPEVQAKIEQSKSRLITEAWFDTYADSQPDADYAAMAEEYYLLNQEEFTRPASVTVQHILISGEGRSAAEAHRIAEDIHLQLKQDKLSFAEAVAQYSEDDAAEQNNGIIGRLQPGQADPVFDQAAFALTEDEPMSDVVDTSFGSHIILLLEQHPAGKAPFSEVEETLVEYMQTQHRNRVVGQYLENIKRMDVEVNQNAIDQYMQAVGGKNRQ